MRKFSLWPVMGLLGLLFVFSACQRDDDGIAKSNEKKITSFSFEGLTPKVTSVIDETAKTITAVVAPGTSVTQLVPSIQISERATISPVSGIAQNFTNPVKYTVTAEDGTIQEYTVTVTVGKNNQSQIIQFNLNVTGASAALIDHNAKTVTIEVPAGTVVTGLQPTIEVSTRATVSPASNVAQNFTSPVKYTVTAEDNSKSEYTVTVNVTKYSLKELTSFNLNQLTPAVTGVIDHTAGTVSLTVPYGTSVSSLQPAIGLPAAATVSPASGAAQNFTNPVKYTVTAEDRTTKQYNVTVTVSANPNKPVVTGLSKTKIEIGQELVVSGTKLGPNIGFVPVGGGVTYGGVGTKNSQSTELRYTIPATMPVGKYKVYVSTATSDMSDLYDQEIEIVAATQPDASITAVNGTTFDRGDIITIAGANFAANATVALKSTFAYPLEIVSVSATEIKAKVPATMSYTTYTWPYDLIVTSAGKEIKWTQGIDIKKSLPVITGINKTTFKPGDKLIITGTHLNADNFTTVIIKFYNKPGSSYVLSKNQYFYSGNLSSTSLEYTLPESWNDDGQYYVSVSIDGAETAVFATPFTYQNQ